MRFPGSSPAPEIREFGIRLAQIFRASERDHPRHAYQEDHPSRETDHAQNEPSTRKLHVQWRTWASKIPVEMPSMKRARCPQGDDGNRGERFDSDSRNSDAYGRSFAEPPLPAHNYREDA